MPTMPTKYLITALALSAVMAGCAQNEGKQAATPSATTSAAAGGTSAVMPAQPAASDPPAGGVKGVFNQAIPNIPGKSVIAAEVSYPPGGKSGAHRHSKSAFLMAYVVEGAIRSQVDGGPVTVYQAGQTWLENPGAHHTISENASTTEPAKILAVFVADSSETDDTLTTFDDPNGH